MKTDKKNMLHKIRFHNLSYTYLKNMQFNWKYYSNFSAFLFLLYWLKCHFSQIYTCQ